MNNQKKCLRLLRLNKLGTSLMLTNILKMKSKPSTESEMETEIIIDSKTVELVLIEIKIKEAA